MNTTYHRWVSCFGYHISLPWRVARQFGESLRAFGSGVSGYICGDNGVITNPHITMNYDGNVVGAPFLDDMKFERMGNAAAPSLETTWREFFASCSKCHLRSDRQRSWASRRFGSSNIVQCHAKFECHHS